MHCIATPFPVTPIAVDTASGILGKAKTPTRVSSGEAVCLNNRCWGIRDCIWRIGAREDTRRNEKSRHIMKSEDIPREASLRDLPKVFSYLGIAILPLHMHVGKAYPSPFNKESLASRCLSLAFSR